MDRVTQLENEITNIKKQLLSVDQLQLRLSNMESWIHANLVNITQTNKNTLKLPSPKFTKTVAGNSVNSNLPKDKENPNSKPIDVSKLNSEKVSKENVPVGPDSRNSVDRASCNKRPREENQIIPPVTRTITLTKPDKIPAVPVPTAGADTRLTQKASLPSCTPTTLSTKLNIQAIPYEPTKKSTLEIAPADSPTSNPHLQEVYVNTTEDGISSSSTKLNGTNSCKKCFQTFHTNESYYHHKIKVHEKFICRFCLKGFGAFAFLKQHESDKHAKVKLIKKQNRISKSSKGTVEPIIIRKDIFAPDSTEVETSGSKRKARGTKKSMEKAGTRQKYSVVETEKKKEATFNCPMCSKIFGDRQNLHQHMRTHTSIDKSLQMQTV